MASPNPPTQQDKWLDEWLRKIDPVMVQYKGKLEEFNYNTEKTLAVLVESDVDAMGIKGGHKRLLLEAVKATSQVPQDTALPSAQKRFLHLLSQTQITNPDKQTIKTIIRWFSSRLIVCESPDDALDLYEDASMMLESTTCLEVKRAHGLVINGPLTIDGNAFILTGIDVYGKPVVVKVLGARGDMEIRNIAAICVPGHPPSIPDITVIEVELPSSELRVMRGRSGVFKALVMPRFITTIVEQVRVSEQLIWEKSQDIYSALEFIHKCGYVHMDVKGANILVTHDGKWVLIDFETVVKCGAPIIGYTESFYPEELRKGKDLAEFKYDWYMFLVCLLIEVTKPDWKDLLFNNQTHRVDRQKVKSAISRISYPQLKEMCERLDE